MIRLRMTRRRLALAVIVAIATPLAACGGPVTPDELARSIGTLESTAAEGAFLADDVADNRTKATFVRVHARDLSDVVEHEAEKLRDAQSDRPEVAEAKSNAIALAERIGTALGQVQIAPGSERAGRSAGGQLSRLSQQAGKLADGL